MADICQTTFWHAFSTIKSLIIWRNFAEVSYFYKGLINKTFNKCSDHSMMPSGPINPRRYMQLPGACPTKYRIDKFDRIQILLKIFVRYDRPTILESTAIWISSKIWIRSNLVNSIFSGTATRSQSVNTFRPRQNGGHFADGIFKCIFLNKNILISTTVSLKIVPKVPINIIPSLVQIMAWCRPSDKPLSEPIMVRLSMHICITRPQWVDTIHTPKHEQIYNSDQTTFHEATYHKWEILFCNILFQIPS